VPARVLAIVAHQTGYPPDMLDLRLDLEADLGIDTVKQAEMFAAVREAWSIPRVDNLQLRDFPTLQHVIGFVRAHRPNTAAPAPTAPTPDAPAPPGPTRPDLLRADEAALASVRRRVPIAVVRPPLALCKPTGVTLAARTIAIRPDRGGVAQALAALLEAEGARVLTLDPGAPPEALAGATGLYWLPALDAHAPWSELPTADYEAALDARVGDLYHAARALYPALGEGAFVVAATRMGGRHGYDEAGPTNPLGGAVTGFVKALRRERDRALVKALDFSADAPPDEVARLLLAETLADPGAFEIGHAGGVRTTMTLGEAPPLPDAPTHPLGPEAVYVVTGAAGSIVSAIIADLAEHGGGGTFYLLDLAPAPHPTTPAAAEDLRLLTADREALRRSLYDRMKAAGERATPAAVDRQIGALERARAALDAIAAVEAAGGVAHYRSLSLTDRAAVTAVMDEVRAHHGRVDVLVHAAGLDVSRALIDKPLDEFRRVFGVKALGLHHLVAGAGDMPIGALVVFGSIAGRFGNNGQTDYAAGNDLLCKLTAALARSRPGLRGVAVDWTAWADIGMASRGSIPKIMAAAGIDMLPAAAGIGVVRRELVAGTSAELVIAGSLGALLAEADPHGGLDLDAARRALRGAMLGEPVAFSVGEGLVVETTLTPADRPFLDHHRIDQTPVLPGVMGIEAFGELARALFPERVVAAVEEVTFEAPFKLYRDAPRTLRLSARITPEGADLVADCRLVGHRLLPGQSEPVATEHFRARVRLAPAPAALEPGRAPPAEPADAAGQDAIYRLYFHGPAYRVLASAWRDEGVTVGRLAADLPDDGAGEAPLEPRLVELCFQTAGFHELAESGRMALPHHVARLVVRAAPRGEPLYALVRARPGGDGQVFDADVVDAAGEVYVRLEGYQTITLPASLDASALTEVRRAFSRGG